MNARTFTLDRVRDNYQLLIMATTGIFLLSMFWFLSRYPQLFSRIQHLGEELPSMAYNSEVFTVAADAPIWKQIAAGTVNWLDNMKIGMSFGVLMGALLHTVLKYYPLKIGENITMNTVKGALVGAPMGVCANCAVPAACGVTRGHGRVEVALGFLFSSPNFNPVVITMTFIALPWTMSVAKYIILVMVIVILVPKLIAWLEREQPLNAPEPDTLDFGTQDFSCAIKPPSPPLLTVLKDLSVDYAKHVWMLFKPTITIMLLAAVLAATALTLIPWDSLLSEITPLRVAVVSLVSVLMPVPITADVMFAAQLHQQGVASGYVMLFAMTLGTYSIIPSIYLWREISKTLSVSLFAFFLCLGCVVGMTF